MAARKRTLRDLLLAFREQLRQHAEAHGSEALTALESLVDAGCSVERLMYTVTAIRLAFQFEARVHGDPARMTSRRLRSLTEKTRWVAREWERELQSPFGKVVLEQAASCDPFSKEIEYLQLPQKLLSLAAEAKAIHRGSRRNRRPLYNDNLAALMEYVKLKTTTYHDSEVAELVWFATGQECDENTLRVSRAQHPRTHDRARLRVSEH